MVVANVVDTSAGETSTLCSEDPSTEKDDFDCLFLKR